MPQSTVPHSFLCARFKDRVRKIIYSVLLVVGLGVRATLAQEPDMVIADFEGTNYGAWKVAGTASGTGPAHGTLHNQMTVDGF